MKRRKRKVLSVLAALCLLLLPGCNATEENSAVSGLENLGSITVISREEGSGTREVFAEKLGLNGSSEGRSDLITENAETAMNADAVKEKVKESKNAVGYLSLGAVTEETDGIKVLKISGTEASSTNVENGKYPLTRNFNIAYNGTLNDAESDFLSYILSEGQNVVAENYSTVKEASRFLSNKASGEIEIEGSTSVQPLMEALAESYEKLNGNVNITVKASDSGSGLTAAMQGSCDFAMSSRELKAYEKELLSYEVIAKDGVAVIVNEENPCESLNLTELTGIFSGETSAWNDLNK